MPVSKKNLLTLTLIAILTLVPLGQTGLVVAATPRAMSAATPSLLITVTSVGAVPTGVAVDETHNYIYVSANGGNHITRINGADWSKAYSATSGVVYRPMGLVVNPGDQRVYVTNGSQYLSIVRGGNLTLEKAVDMGSGNTQIDVALNASLGYAFAVDFDHDRVYAVSTSSQTKTKDIGNLADTPAKIALSPDGKVAYVTCVESSSVDIIDTTRHELVARYFDHFNHPVGVAVNPLNGYIYVANVGDPTSSKTKAGYVVVVDDRNDLKHTINVGGYWIDGKGVMGVAYNPTTNHIFVTQRGTPGNVFVYDGTSYAHIKTIAVGNNPDAFITVDTTRNRVYVTNQGSNSVSVIQDTVTAISAPPPAAHPPSEEAAASASSDEPSPIPCPFWMTDTLTGIMPQGIAVDDVQGKGYVANNVSNTVSRVNLDTNVVEATSSSPVVFGPTATAVNTSNQRVYVANGSPGYKSLSVLDGPSLSLLAYISPLKQTPRFIYMATDADRAYVVNTDGGNNNYLSEIKLSTNQILQEIAVGKGANAVAVSQDRAIAYVSCHDTSAYGGSYLSVVDISKGKEVAQFFIHYNQPTDIVMDPARDRIYVSNEGGNDAVVAVDHRNLLKKSLNLGSNPAGLALNPAFYRLAVVQKDSRSVSFIDTNSFTQPCVPVFLTLTVDRWIAFSARNNRFYVSGTGGNTVSVIQDYIGDGYENDDSYNLAKTILSGAAQIHSIDPAGDVDWVKLNVGEPMTLTFSATNIHLALDPLRLSLYGTDGTTLLVSGTNEIPTYPFATAGTYYLKVNATAGNVGNASYTYRLLVTGGPPSYILYMPLVFRQEED